MLEERASPFGRAWAIFWIDTIADLGAGLCDDIFAEWGDRSQIATVAMAAGSDYWWVIIGSVFGHFICTGSAVIGGKLLATKITLKNVTLTGALLLLFSQWFTFMSFL